MGGQPAQAGLMIRAVRLAWALQRFELRMLVGVALLLAVAALVIAWQIRVVRDEQLACFHDAPPAVEGSTGSPCSGQDPQLRTLEDAAGFVRIGIFGAPFVLGLFLGGPVVARELEHRTAHLAWSLSRGRRTWLFRRAGPLLAILAVASVAAGVGGEVLTHAMPWAEDAEVGFADYGGRGPLVPVRTAAVFSIGLAAGAVTGRQLPALLLSAGVTVAFFVGLQVWTDEQMQGEAVPLDSAAQQQGASSRIYGSALRDEATGTLISWEEYYAEHPDAGDELPPGLAPVVFGVPGHRYGEFVLRESAMLGGVGALAVGLTALAVSRRRP